MKRVLNYLKSKMKISRRKSLRLQPVTTFSCSILKEEAGERRLVQVCDLSAHGIGFVSDENSFDIGEKVTLNLRVAENGHLIVGGEIVNQMAYVPEEKNEVAVVLARYSVKFHQPIDQPLPSCFASSCDPWL